MSAETLAYRMVLDHRPQAPAGGILRFPTTACAGRPTPCPQCLNCADDCSSCTLCRYGECERCAIPDLTPRTAMMLVVAGTILAEQTRAEASHGCSPVFHHHVVRAFERLVETLNRGARPRPGNVAEQLCTHLMITQARELACVAGEVYVTGLPVSGYDYDFPRLYDTLLPDDEHDHLVEMGEAFATGESAFSFTALADLMTRESMNAFFAPFGTGERLP